MDNILGKKRKICTTVDEKNNKKTDQDIDQDTDKDNIKKLLIKRRKTEKERYKCAKQIEECKRVERELNKKIYNLCEHEWIAEDRQMYEKRWYLCGNCGLYRNSYMYR